MRKTKFCEDCGKPSSCHIQTWLDGISGGLQPLFLPRKLKLFFNFLLDNIFIFFNLLSMQDNFTSSDIQLKSTCFIKEARKKGVRFKAFHGPFGYTNYFQAEINGKKYRFDGLPIADFTNKHRAQLVDNKGRTKRRLKEGGFPVAKGRVFWFWQKKKAIEFGMKEVKIPLVVKPRSGSGSRHVTTDIQNIQQLRSAIDRAIIYSPVFIVEKFISNAFVYRATVVDFDFIVCVKQVPANIVGDGISTIRELIDKKNKDPFRGRPNQKEFTLYKIVENEITRNLLAKRNYNYLSVPQKNETVWLQKNPFLKMGGGLVEVTSNVHPDNLLLFRNIVEFFGIKVVGIDFMCKDISVSWKNQKCAILELNSMPCIELHHFPSEGKPQNVAGALVKLFFKYYL